MDTTERYQRLTELIKVIQPPKSTPAAIEELFSDLSPEDYLGLFKLALEEQPRVLATELVFERGRNDPATYLHGKVTTVLCAYGGQILKTSEQRAVEQSYRDSTLDFLDTMLRLRIWRRD